MGHLFDFYHLQTVNFQKLQKGEQLLQISFSPSALHPGIDRVEARELLHSHGAQEGPG